MILSENFGGAVVENELHSLEQGEHVRKRLDRLGKVIFSSKQIVSGL